MIEPSPRTLGGLMLLFFLLTAPGLGQENSTDRFPDLKPKPPGTARWEDPLQDPDAGEDTGIAEPLAWNPKPVAQFVWRPGPRKELVLHGTLPVPDTFEFAPAGCSPIGIRMQGREGPPAAAQVHAVAHDATGRVQVIEVLFPIRLPGDRTQRGPLRFDVFTGAFPLPKPAPEPESRSRLMGAETSPYLTTQDVFGNTYRFDLNPDPEALGVVSRNVLKSGFASRQWKLAGALMPFRPGEGGAPLPHMMSVHAYLTTWGASNLVSLDLRIHNGLTAASG
ncbi:MAG: hypothetical protein KDB61_06765, partial [Planctomycetes bacterium]|nr:hypothetical protein [Planctomycetota bacterium]